MKTKKIHHYMNKTIHVSAIVLAILILTVGCQGKKGGSRAEDEGSNTVLADSTIQKYSGKATVTGSEYLDKLSEICRYSVDSLDGGGCSLDLDILESRFADEIFLDLDEDVHAIYRLYVRKFYRIDTLGVEIHRGSHRVKNIFPLPP